MKKNILIVIATIAILSNSCLQSADWISNRLPSFLYVDSKWQQTVKNIQEKTGTSTPIIFMNSNREHDAAVYNVGIHPFRFAIMLVNQSKFKYGSAEYNIQTLTHETVKDTYEKYIIIIIMFC